MPFEVPGPYNFCAWIVSYGMKQLTSHLYPSLWYIKKGFPNNSVKNFPAMQETWRPGFDPWLGSSPGEGKGYSLQYSWASLVAQLVKNLPAVQETWRPGFDPWVGKPPWRRERLPTQLAWRIPWIALSMGSQRVRHNWLTFTLLYGRYPSIWFILFMILSIFIFLKLAECMFFFFSFSPFPFGLSLGAYILLFLYCQKAGKCVNKCA